MPGLDEICPEQLKYLDVKALSWLTHLCNITWLLGKVPSNWQARKVVPLFRFRRGMGWFDLTIEEQL